MVVVKLMGGLGNQLFQYSAGKALALEKNVPLFLDISFLNGRSDDAYTRRHFELDQLALNYKTAGDDMLHLFKQNPSFLKLFKKNRNPDFPVYTEQMGTPGKLHVSNAYLDGYWQSEKYFSSIRSVLLKEIAPRYDLQKEFKKYFDQVNVTDSVGLHVRRGDYVHLKSANEFHGVCGMDYFNKAIGLVRSKIKQAVFFIFSDDMTWCEENFKHVPDAVFMKTPDLHSSLDLFLMSHCRHNIIANSSYSWWSAWLNIHEDKIVIAPEKWFNSTEMNARDVIPEKWIKI
jgi:hypothetical protein